MPDDLDVGVGSPDEDRIGFAVEQDRFRQLRPLIWKVGFLADQGDRADMAARPQGFGRAASRLSGSNDNDACLRQVHRVRSLAAAQPGPPS